MDILEFYNSFLLDIPYEIGLILASVSDVISCIILAFTEMLFVKYLCGEKGNKIYVIIWKFQLYTSFFWSIRP